MTDKGSSNICDDQQRGPSKSEFQVNKQNMWWRTNGQTKDVMTDKGVVEKWVSGHQTKYVMTDKGSNNICDEGHRGPSKSEFQVNKQNMWWRTKSQTKYVMTNKRSNKRRNDGQRGPSKVSLSLKKVRQNRWSLIRGEAFSGPPPPLSSPTRGTTSSYATDLPDDRTLMMMMMMNPYTRGPVYFLDCKKSTTYARGPVDRMNYKNLLLCKRSSFCGQDSNTTTTYTGCPVNCANYYKISMVVNWSI